MSIPITVRQERDEDFFDPYVTPDESLWVPIDDVARDIVQLRHIWRDIRVLYEQRVATEDPLVRAVLGRYLILELCTAEDFLGAFGKHLKQAPKTERAKRPPRTERAVPKAERASSFRAAMKRFNVLINPLREELRTARNTFVGHRGQKMNGESIRAELRRLRRHVAMPDDPAFVSTLDALHAVVDAATMLGVGEYERRGFDPATGRHTVGFLTPLRPL